MEYSKGWGKGAPKRKVLSVGGVQQFPGTSHIEPEVRF